MGYPGRLFDGRVSHAQAVEVTVIEGGLRIEASDGGALEFWAWVDLPRSCLTVSGATTVVARGPATLEVPGRAFYADLARAYPRAELFRSPFQTWTAPPARMGLTLAVAVGLVVFLVGVSVPWCGDAIAAGLPPEAQARWGASLKAQLTAGLRVDAEANARLQRFWDLLDLPVSQPTTVTLVDDGTTKNAFALPGGQIVVYQALVDQCQSADELAGVLAHEAAHGELKHAARLLGQALAGSLVLSVLVGNSSGPTGVLVANLDSLRSLQYSRDREAEADRWAAQVLANKADVRRLGALLKRIEDHPTAGWEIFLSNHPATADRDASWRSAPGTPASSALVAAFEELKTPGTARP